jgi:hypothetical protein
MCKLLFPIAALVILSSCVNTKRFQLVYIPKGQDVYKRQTSGSSTSVEKYKVTAGWQAQVKEESNFILVTNKVEGDEKVDATINQDLGPTTTSYFAPLNNPPSSADGKHTFGRIVYYEMSPIFQAVSIPFKYLPKTGSRPYEVSTGVNTGFSYGFKFTRNAFKRTYDKTNFLGSIKRQYSITPGIFLGPTTVKLNAGNTENYLTGDRTVFGMNTGIMTVFGVNKFNVGIAMGWDDAWGGPGNRWVYDGKTWYGFIVALEFIK